MRNSLSTLVGAAALTLVSTSAWAQDKVIKFGFAQDFTKVYTFVSSEYSQGQRDYLSLINTRGGIKGYTFEATVVDHGNDFFLSLSSHVRRGSIHRPRDAIMDCDKVADRYV